MIDRKHRPGQQGRSQGHDQRGEVEAHLLEVVCLRITGPQEGNVASGDAAGAAASLHLPNQRPVGIPFLC